MSINLKLIHYNIDIMSYQIGKNGTGKNVIGLKNSRNHGIFFRIEKIAQ